MIKYIKSKNFIIIFIGIVLFSLGIIALTQEADLKIPEIEESETSELTDETENDMELDLPPRKPTQWFISNSGGMALEETESRFVAMRSEYSLVVDYPGIKDYPEIVLEYVEDEYTHEIRSLYKNGELQRSQWIFRDENDTTRVNTVFIQAKEKKADAPSKISGFIEILDENSFLTTEINYLDDGGQNKIEYVSKNNLIITAVVSDWDADSKELIESYTDYYRYNRSLSLRAVERVFSKETKISEPMRIAFPRYIMNAIEESFLSGQKMNIIPDFFGDLFASASMKMIFDTDERGRILSQTLFDENDEIVWVINNKWLNDRIISTSKTEGDTVLTAEYQYSAGGDRIAERNLRDGNLERIVRTSNKTDTEELYYDGVLVMRAVWEDGKKISETMIR